jgi:hypothetical protein
VEITETPNTINEIGCAIKDTRGVKKQNILWTDSDRGKFTWSPYAQKGEKIDNPI